MKYISLLFLLPLFVFAEPAPDDRESFLAAWEKLQSNHDALEKFSKVSDSKYKIKFRNIPFEGTLVILNYDIEEFPNYGASNDFTKTGYIEIDIPGELDGLIQKYNRTYFNWANDNTLYFNSKTNTWVTPKEFSSSFKKNSDSLGNKIVYSIFEYWSYALILIILYFVWSNVVNNKRTKMALLEQREAFKNSIKIGEESVKLQNDAIESGKKAHEKTNYLLAEILQELKK